MQLRRCGASLLQRSQARAIHTPQLPSCMKCLATAIPPTGSSITRVCGPTLGRRAAIALTGAVFFASRGVAAASAARSEMEQVLMDPKWPEKFPFKPSDFERYDEQSDALFYSYPRLVTHIDDYAIAALTKYYGQQLPPSGSGAVLDICSSWISHYPEGWKGQKVAGLGMNPDELKENVHLTEWVVKDLNTDPTLPFEDNTFDVITNTVSVDYLNKPLEVFREMHRVLKPGGKALMAFSNRCFATKAISIWTSTADPDHIWIVGSYYHYSVPGGWSEPRCDDISPKLGFQSDPMYVISATKQA